MAEWIAQGAHRYYLQNDVMFWECHGEVKLDDLKTTYDILQRLHQTYGYTLSVYDASRGVSMGPEARRYSAAMNRTISLNGASTIFGAGMVLRTVMHLLHNVARMLGRAIPPVYYCASQEEAMKWLETQRQLLAAGPAKK